jgi:hypothetical protein
LAQYTREAVWYLSRPLLILDELAARIDLVAQQPAEEVVGLRAP